MAKAMIVVEDIGGAVDVSVDFGYLERPKAIEDIDEKKSPAHFFAYLALQVIRKCAEDAGFKEDLKEMLGI